MGDAVVIDLMRPIAEHGVGKSLSFADRDRFDKVSLMLKPRHKKELEQCEIFLIELFLDVRRPRDDRGDCMYREEMEGYRRMLGSYERRAKWLLDIILARSQPWRCWSNRVRRVERAGGFPA